MENKVVLGVYCVIEDNGKILLTEDVGKPGWKLPGGKVEENEKLEEAVKREVREEINLDIIPEGVVALEEYIKPTVEHRIRIFMRARRVGGEIKMAKDEVSKFVWVTIDDVQNMKEKDFFKDFYYEAIRKYLSGTNMPIGSFLITTIRNFS